MYEGVVQDLIDELGRLPGVGPKSAQRIAFHLLQADPIDVKRLVSALVEVKDKVRFCAICGNVAQEEQCRICRDPRRDRALICVVEEPKDVVAIERTREFRGRYHVLGGAISPIEGIGPDDLRIRELLPGSASGDGHRDHHRHRPQPRGRGHRHLPGAPAAPDGPAGHPARVRAAGRRRPGVRRRGHPRPRVRGKEAARCLTTWPVLADETAPDARLLPRHRDRGGVGRVARRRHPAAAARRLAGARRGRPARRRSRTSCRTSATRPTPARTPTSTRCGRAWPTSSRAWTTTPTSSTRSLGVEVARGSLVRRPRRAQRRPHPRPAALRRRPGHRGPVVVAVQLPVRPGATAPPAILRVLQAVLGHIRLDADEELVAEAEFDALHP